MEESSGCLRSEPLLCRNEIISIVAIWAINYHAPLLPMFLVMCIGNSYTQKESTRSVVHVLAAAKKESQAQQVLALSQVPQASSRPSKALPNLPPGAQEITS